MHRRALRPLLRCVRARAPLGRLRVVPAVTAAVALVAAAAPAWATGALGGGGIPNTAGGDPGAQLAAPPSVVQKLTLPFDGVPAAGTGDSGSPEDDLAGALDDLAQAPDAAAATTARTIALAILEGNPLPRKPYSGIPLLNWNAPAKVKTVPPGGDVTVRIVQFGDHVISDTALLDFADPNATFTITYRVAQVGVGFGGVFAPTLLLADGGSPIGGQPSVVEPLALPELAAGTSTKNKFHPGGAPEHTRLAVQQFTVRMPPPRYVEAVVDPGYEPGPGGASLVTLRRATPDRVAALAADFGFSGAAPTDAQKLAAIARLGGAAPEKQIWTHLHDLDPAAPGFLDAARRTGAQDRPLVGAMRSRYALPAGVQGDGGADVSVVLLNDEAYVSKRRVHLDAGRPLTVSVTNADGFPHRFEALELRDRVPAFGATDWGEFRWSVLADAGSLAAGASRTVMLAPSDTAFQLWLGDPDSGDQSGLPLALDRGALRQSLRFTPAWAHPNHVAVDAGGNLWVTLGGVDAIAEVTPAPELANAAEREFTLPGGDASFATGGKLDPHDVAVDGHGIVWATLADGNAIARLDPDRAHPGSSDGIRVYALPACPACKPAFPVEPGQTLPPSRTPEQLAVQDDARGGTVVWFTELEANAIGALRVSADGTPLAQVDVPCGCIHPKGIALGDDGSVWFTEEDGNRLGRLEIDPGPFDAGGAHVAHYPVPTAPQVARPGAPDVATASPHSVAVDGTGRVWFTEEAAARVGYLDPARARAGATDGFTELPLPNNAFREQIAPADLVADRGNTIFFADEYGDAVGSATAAGLSHLWRPRERQSLTDDPTVDLAGNLWVAETGANLLTRFSGVAAPAASPAPAPILTADTAHHTVSGAGLRDVATVDVSVERAGTVVASASGAAAGGTFSVDVAVHANDVVRVALGGPYPHAPISFRALDVHASVAADGSVGGTVGAGGAVLTDAVQVDVAGRVAVAAITRDGSFSTTTGLAAATASGTVSVAGATRAAIFRTVAGFGAAAAATPAPAAPAPAAVSAPKPAPAAGSATAPAVPAVPAAPSSAAVATPDYNALGRRALALVTYPWRSLGYRIGFTAERPDVRAETDTGRRTIVVYVRASDPPERIAHDIAHELGHAFDARYLKTTQRRAFLRARGKPNAPWFPSSRGSDYATGAGDFAEVFALCYAASTEFRSTLAPRPANPCSLVRAARGKMKTR